MLGGSTLSKASSKIEYNGSLLHRLISSASAKFLSMIQLTNLEKKRNGAPIGGGSNHVVAFLAFLLLKTRKYGRRKRRKEGGKKRRKEGKNREEQTGALL